MKTLEDLENDAGEELTDKIMESLENEENAVTWFYDTPLIPLGGISPHEAYKKGMADEIEAILLRIEHGVY